MADILQGGVRDTISTSQFAVTNITQDYALDCNGEAGALACADVLGTLIRELIRKGIINGTVA
jgi:hypothetical protein